MDFSLIIVSLIANVSFVTFSRLFLHWEFVKMKITLVTMQFTLVNMQFTLVKMQFTLVNTQFTCVNIQFTLVNMQFTLVNMQFTLEINTYVDMPDPDPNIVARTCWPIQRHDFVIRVP